MGQKLAYICGPLTELSPDEQARVKAFYTAIADVVGEVAGVRAFVPHEHYDPLKHPNFTAAEVDVAERAQVCNETSMLIVVTVAPSWGGGIEVEMANQSGVPVLLICENEKLRTKKVSRLLRGNPAVVKTIGYSSEEDALAQLRVELPCFRYALAPA